MASTSYGFPSGPDGVRCDTCVYRHAFEVRDGDERREKLQCRREPPKVVRTDKGLQGRWPLVRPYDWCGEHAVREG